MANEQGSQNTNSVFKTETRVVRIYRREYRLPVLLSDSWKQRHKDIRKRSQLVKEGKPTFLGLSRKPLTIDESIETLNSLMNDYESMIHFIFAQKTSYTQFFADLVDEIKGITTEKCQKIASLEQKRTILARRAEQDQELQLIYRNQQSQLLEAAQLVGSASLLMLKKLELIQGALAKLANDQEIQRQIFDEMLGHLNIYTETHRLQKEIADIQLEAADMARVAIDFEKYVGKYLGSIQGFINEVVKIDQKLSIALEEIKGLTDMILGESEMSSINSDQELSESLMSWLTQSTLKETRLTDALEDVEKQTLLAAEIDIQLLLANTESDSVLETLTKIQAHLEPFFTQLTSANLSPTVDSGDKSTTQLDIVQPPHTDDLSSDRNVDYTRLRDLLTAGNWKDADYETYLVMIKVVGRKYGDWIREEELLNFPCTDLRTIDSLWVKYSYGRFGFSVQKKIYLKVGSKPDGKYYAEVYQKFGDRVGWRVNKRWIEDQENLTFDTRAPVGHLPYFSHLPYFCPIQVPKHKTYIESPLVVFFSRIQTCKL